MRSAQTVLGILHTHSSTEEGLVFSLVGPLDSHTTGQAWRTAFRVLQRENPRRLIVDATQLTYCDGAGAALLLPTSETASTSVPSSMVLKIHKFRVVPLFAGRPMVYRAADLQYESDFYNEWFIAPGALATQQFHEWLSKSGRFQFVTMGANHVEPTHLLEGTVTDLYGDYRDSPKAVLGMDLHLLDGIDERQILMRRSYRKDVTLPDRSADALAQGLSQAMRQVLADFERDLTTIKGNPAQPLR